MKIKVLFFVFLFLNLHSQGLYLDEIMVLKAQKQVLKEEMIARAYKKYLRDEGKIPSDIAALKTSKYLPDAFSEKNIFADGDISIEKKSSGDNTNTNTNTKVEALIKSKIPKIKKLFLYREYFLNENRKDTVVSPLSSSEENHSIRINLSTYEEFILRNASSSSTTNTTGENSTGNLTVLANGTSRETIKSKYYFDRKTRSIIYNDENGKPVFFLGENNIIIDDNSTDTAVISSQDGTSSTDISETLKEKIKVLSNSSIFMGMDIFVLKNNTLSKYVLIDKNLVPTSANGGDSSESSESTPSTTENATTSGAIKFFKRQGGV